MTTEEMKEIDFSKDGKLVDLVIRQEGIRRLLADLERDYGHVGIDINDHVCKHYPEVIWAEWMYDQFRFKFVRRNREVKT